MEFRTAYQDKWPHGSVNYKTPLEFASHQTCNCLNMLYRNIHYSDNMSNYGYESPIVILSIIFNTLKYYLSCLEKVKAEYEPDFNKQYQYYFETIAEELSALEKSNTQESEYTKSIKDVCDKLIFKGFDILSKVYPEHEFYIKNTPPNA